MSVTFEVLKLLKSKLVNDEHLENILRIFVTFDVLKLFKSKLVIDEHSKNIRNIFVIFEVLKLLLKLMIFKLEKSENIFKQSVGANIGTSLTIYKLYKVFSVVVLVLLSVSDIVNPLSIK